MILFILIFGVILYVAEKYSMKRVLDQVKFATSLSRVLVEPGEEFL